jgi:ParB-like chromosome segregation protein Spo0J
MVAGRLAKDKRNINMASGNGTAIKVTSPEFGLVRIVEMDLSAIRPSPQNELLYRPVSPSDPEVLALRDSIRSFGLKEPIVVTLDGYIISGHRRHMACKLAGLKRAPCRIENIHSSNPHFVRLLREYNRQRVKSLDEVMREEVVSMNPEEAHRILVEHRKAKSRVDVQEIFIAGEKRRAKISKHKKPFLDAIEAILQRLRDYWPLSVRQIHYNLLNKPPLIHAAKPETYTDKKNKVHHNRYCNTIQCYKSADELLVRARFEGIIPFEAISDKTRSVQTWDLDRGVATFVRRELNDLFKGYYRDLQQSQPNHLEIVGEKNTVESVIRPVAMEYCIPYTLGRGYNSVPPRKAMARRFLQSGKEKLIILNLGDFDPEGEDIPHSFARSMRDDLGIKNVVAVKVGLTLEQVRALRLPPQMKAKKDSSRYTGFVDRYGDDVHELEAVPPEWLQQKLRDNIDSVLDVDAYNREIDAEKEDAARLDAIREKVKAMLFRENLLSKDSDLSELDDERG